MNRFNLTFSGEILPGHEPEQVKLLFGKMFAIDDPVRLERFFSGETIILRRNLERKTAAEYFQKLRQLGVETELVKITAKHAAGSIANIPPSSETTTVRTGTGPDKRGTEQENVQHQPGHDGQSWPVSSAYGRHS